MCLEIIDCLKALINQALFMYRLGIHYVSASFITLNPKMGQVTGDTLKDLALHAQSIQELRVLSEGESVR